MNEPDQLAEFGSIEQEVSFKRSFYQKFIRLLNPDDVQLPLRILPNTDKINVSLDDQPVGTVRMEVREELNTFRYPYGVHRFRFTRDGYQTVEITTTDSTAPLYSLVLESLPAGKQ